MTYALTLFSLLVVAHFVCDYPLQGDFLSKAKNHRAPFPGVPWGQALAAHAVIHGGAVGILTGHWWLGVAEVIAHAAIDYLKCDGLLSFNVDQALHIACKVVWVALAIWVLHGL
jgi:hypothetical protein